MDASVDADVDPIRVDTKVQSARVHGLKFVSESNCEALAARGVPNAHGRTLDAHVDQQRVGHPGWDGAHVLFSLFVEL